MKKKLILSLLVAGLLIAFVAILVVNSQKDPLTYTYNPQTSTRVSSNSYTDYIEQVAKDNGGVTPVPQNVEKVVLGVDYDKAKTSISEEDLLVYSQSDLGITDSSANDKMLYTPERGNVTWTFNMEEAGLYNLILSYYPIKGTSSSIERHLSINNKAMFDKTTTYVFSRIWGNDAETLTGEQLVETVKNDNNTYWTKLNPDADTKGNDVKPLQKEVPHLRESYFTDDMGYITEPFKFYFEKGTNTITLGAVKECVVIESIKVVSVKESVSYEEYKASVKDKVATPGTYAVRVEAEAAIEKSSPTLYPITDRTSSATYPFDYKETKLNAIGGENWRVLGDWITWEVDVPADGFYNISLRTKQSSVRGMYTNRIVSVDGEVVFDELNQTIFAYSSDWQLLTLGNSEESFEFYLEKGKHTVSLEVTLGDYAGLVEEIEAITQDLNDLYLEIIKYTTTSPDSGRDYELSSRKDLDLLNRLEVARDRLKKVSQSMIDISGTGSDKTGVIDAFVVQLDDFLAPNDLGESIPSRLSTFRTNISSLGTLLSSLRESPLTIDYLIVHTADYVLPKANESGLRSFWDGVVKFFYSFFIDYSTIGAIQGNNQTNEKIEVWMTLGRDQANVIRRLIDEDFTPRTGIEVDLKLTGADVLLKATLAGIGPNVAINVDSSLPVNYGLRNAVYDISQFDDYEEIAARFTDSSNRQFTFDWGGANGRDVEVYALPEKELFLMMFVRDDIMEKNGWTGMIPETWDEVIDLVAYLQAESLQFFLPVNESGATALNPTFVSLLYQMGGNLYIDNNKQTGLLQEAGMEAFEQWTEFYTLHSFPSWASFANRFRTGEMPIGIAYYELYNTLSVFAPELRGLWSYHPIPGTVMIDDNGNEYIDHTSVISGTGTVLLKGPAEASASKRDASWEFMKWWSSSNIQYRFGQEMEGILGSAARHATANVEALKQLAWPQADLEQLLLQWGESDSNDTILINGVETPYYTTIKNGVSRTNVYGVHEMPQIAGSYITGREVENAFRQVINDKVNAKETLYQYAQNINNEIDRKRNEFKLPLASEGE